MKNECIIITKRKEDYHNFLEEDIKEAECKECKETVIYGDITFRHAEQEKIRKKFKGEIQFLCDHCYKKLPKFGKLIRPNQEMINRMRKDGFEIDEVRIREMMHAIKHKEV